MIPVSRCPKREAQGQEIICPEAHGRSYWALNPFRSDSKANASFAGHMLAPAGCRAGGWRGCRQMGLGHWRWNANAFVHLSSGASEVSKQAKQIPWLSSSLPSQ